jgi:hypothetical protein
VRPQSIHRLNDGLHTGSKGLRNLEMVIPGGCACVRDTIPPPWALKVEASRSARSDPHSQGNKRAGRHQSQRCTRSQTRERIDALGRRAARRQAERGRCELWQADGGAGGLGRLGCLGCLHRFDLSPCLLRFLPRRLQLCLSGRQSLLRSGLTRCGWCGRRGILSLGLLSLGRGCLWGRLCLSLLCSCGLLGGLRCQAPLLLGGGRCELRVQGHATPPRERRPPPETRRDTRHAHAAPEEYPRGQRVWVRKGT